MTKLRTPLSIEDAVTLVYATVGGPEACRITGKSDRLIRMWGDPDDDAHQIPVYQAIRLDSALVARGDAPAILTAYRAALRDATTDPQAVACPSVRLLDVVAEVGDVAAAVRAAVNPGSSGGAAITPSEAKRILHEVGELRGTLDAMERDVLARIGPVAVGAARS